MYLCAHCQQAQKGFLFCTLFGFTFHWIPKNPANGHVGGARCWHALPATKHPLFLSKKAWRQEIQQCISVHLCHILKPDECCILLNSCKDGGQHWKSDWAWYFTVNLSKSKQCHCVPGVDGGPGSPLSLQHTLLLPGARQRGGGGAGERAFTRAAQSFTTGGLQSWKSVRTRVRPGRCSPAVFPVQHQTAEASRKKLEEEVTAFLSVLKNDGLAESKIFQRLSNTPYTLQLGLMNAWVCSIAISVKASNSLALA